MLSHTNKVTLRRSLVPCFAMMLGFIATPGFAQTTPSDMSTNEQNVSGEQNANLSSSPTANVTVQSITGGGASYRMTPNAPGMPSFAGGPCIGASMAASGAIPGVSFGGGVSKEDASCQRRNWVQTLIGASQSLSPEDALFMKRLAFEVMRDDEYLSPGFARLGVAPPTNTVKKNFWGKPIASTSGVSVATSGTAETAPQVVAAVAAPRPVARAAKSCVVVVAASAPAQMKALLGSKGCAVVVR
jgi:hypothetical protein